MAHEDELSYERVAAELESGQLRPGLWTKALSKALGDESLAKPLYIEWRVEQLMAEAQAPVKRLTRAYETWLGAQRSLAPTAILHLDPKSQALIAFEEEAAAYALRCLNSGQTRRDVEERLRRMFPEAVEEPRATDFRKLLAELRQRTVQG